MIVLLGISKNEEFINDIKEKDTNILFVETFNELIKIINKHDVDEIVVDTTKFSKKDLNNISKIYSGIVIGKVENEPYGIDLMRNSLIKEYFVCGDESCGIHRCMQRVANRVNLENISKNIKQGLYKLSELVEK